jgi:creatinine amidohydrolase
MTEFNIPWGQYERLRPAQIESIRAVAPIAYLPWGALEWHSYHNAIGLDGLKAHGLMKALARQCGGVVLPPVYLGTDTIKPFKGFPHTIDHTQDLVRDTMSQFLEQLVDEKFRVIVFLTGHYGGGHVKAQEDAVAAFRKRHPDIALWAFADWQPLEGRFPPNHAAHGETSFLMHFDPECVDLSMLPQDRVTTLDEDGVWGDDPREASAEDGTRMVQAFLEVAVPKVRELLATINRPQTRE